MDEISGGFGNTKRASLAAVCALMIAILAWLWPIGLGGKMPVGGDVTAFSLGPMSVLSHALKSGRLPIWNELWGYGFPGVGESQMGVYYPVHLVLYGVFVPEMAYTISLVAHTLWGGLGAWFAARRLGVSNLGSFLCGFAWSTCGFFVIHLPHQWGYTTGSWMPWIWGLGWTAARGEGKRKAPLLLALALAVQLLPGHFQLAFCTQVGLLLIVAEVATERLLRREAGLAGPCRVLCALASAFCLAGAQVWPTLRLARLAAQGRDFEYLSGFAATPLHLVTFLAPGLFETSPLWRMLVWDPFHTSPEEYLGYVGLVPLFLGLIAVRTGWKTSGAVRALLFVGLVTALFALGPYVPGFRTLCLLPGFSFFRAPARWMLAVSLALCLLAGLGLDALTQWKSARRSLLWFCAGVVLLVGLVVGSVELCVQSSGTFGEPVSSWVLDRLPWGTAGVLKRLASDANRPFIDPRVYETWARQGVDLKTAPRPVFNELHITIYRQELFGTGILLVVLAASAIVMTGSRRKALPYCLLILTVLDLSLLGRVQRVDLGPLRALADESNVLAGLSEGMRTVDTLRNMPMVVGANPVSSYRTLDLPAMEPLTALARRVPASPSEIEIVASAIRATGSRLRIFDPFEVMELDRNKIQLPYDVETVDDPHLAEWRFGFDFVKQRRPEMSKFRLWTLPRSGVQAWLVPLTSDRRATILGEWSGDPSTILSIFADAKPVEVEHLSPEVRAFRVHAEVPAMILFSELADSQWHATWTGLDGERAGAIGRAFGRANQGAWQVIQVPGPGDWTLRLSYHARDVELGLMISAVSFVVFGLLYVVSGRVVKGVVR